MYTHLHTHSHTHILVPVLAQLPDTGHMVSSFKEAKPDRMTTLETTLDVEQPVEAVLSDPAPMGERNIHPPMGWPHHSEWEGWGAAQSDGTVRPSRTPNYIIPTLCEVILRNSAESSSPKAITGVTLLHALAPLITQDVNVANGLG